MIDVSVSYNRYKFIGEEFLTWLWFVIEKETTLLSELDPDGAQVTIGNRIVLENRHQDTVESITIKGDDAGLEEGVISLQKGAVVTEMNLSYKSGDHQWVFNLKGESLSFSGLKPPETAPIDRKEDIEGAVLEKIYLFDRVFRFVDAVFGKFIHLRVSKAWLEREVPRMRAWIAT
ncbi:MAG: hypothetical protein R6W88_11265 [Desulfobacterales bacterium]|jgi:hypothetical protein